MTVVAIPGVRMAKHDALRAAPPAKKIVYPYDALDDLLYDWFCWESGYSAARGYSSVDKSFAMAGSSRQWQGTSEILEETVTKWQMEQVEACIDELDPDLRLAIRIEMSNRQGPAVWRNPRAGSLQPVMYAEAKAKIAPMLQKRGVVYE